MSVRAATSPLSVLQPAAPGADVVLPAGFRAQLAASAADLPQAIELVQGYAEALWSLSQQGYHVAQWPNPAEGGPLVLSSSGGTAGSPAPLPPLSSVEPINYEDFSQDPVRDVSPVLGPFPATPNPGLWILGTVRR